MEILFWICVLTWFFQRAATDVLYAAAGKPNPRYELKKQKAIAAGQSPAAQPRYGTRDWFGDLWSDALAANTDKRRAGKAKAKPVDDMLDVAKVRADDDKPAVRERRPEPAARAEDAEGISVVHDDQHPYCTESCGPNCGQYGWSCNRCGARQDGFVTLADARAASWHECRPAEQKPDPAPTAPTNPTGEKPKLATVIPMFPTAKEIVMPNINGEVNGLDPAISYTKALAQFAGEHGSAGNEGYIGFLAKSKVKGEGLQSAHDMQEAFANAQAAATRHAAELAKQKTVQEAYDQNPDAGDKDMMLNGR